MGRSFVLAIVALALASGIAGAQGTNGLLMKLGPRSDQEIGCFGPCACPVLIHEPMTGSFRLVPAGQNANEERYDVRDVDWSVDTHEGPQHITGSGSYLRTLGGDPQQRMMLDLSLDGAAPLRFDSGLDPVTTPWPAIEVVISRHGEFCWDSVYTVSAASATAGVIAGEPPRLATPRPSPFRDRVDLGFTLASAQQVEIAVFEPSGRRVRTLIPTSWQSAGPHSVSWNGVDDRGRSVAAGVLFVRLRTSYGTGQTTLVRVR